VSRESGLSTESGESGESGLSGEAWRGCVELFEPERVDGATSAFGAGAACGAGDDRRTTSSGESMLAGDGADAGESGLGALSSLMGLSGDGSETGLGALTDAGLSIESVSATAGPLRSAAESSMGSGGSLGPARIELMPNAPAAKAAVAVPAVMLCQRERCFTVVLQDGQDRMSYVRPS
jgi:hypothetical protein